MLVWSISLIDGNSFEVPNLLNCCALVLLNNSPGYIHTKAAGVVILLIIIFVHALSAYGQKIKTVKITNDFRYIYPDDGQTFYIEDKNGSVLPEHFLRLYSEGNVKANYAKMPYFDKSESFWWLGMKVQNITSELKRLVVEVDFVYMDQLDFYLWENGKLVKTVSNFSWKTASRLRPIPHRVFAVEFPVTPQKTYIWAVRIQKKDGYLAVPVRMFEYHEFEHLSKLNYNAHGIAIGIMLLGIVMGLALYLLSQDIMYAYYIGYIFSVSGMVVSEQGYLNQYFLSLYNILPTHNTWIYFLSIGVICHIRFSLIFLGIEDSGRRFWITIGKVLTAMAFIVLLAAFIPGSSRMIYDLALFTGLGFSLLNVIYNIIAFKARHSVALMYLLAITPFTICSIYISSSTLGFVPESWFIFELYKYGPIWEILILSVVVCFVYQNTLKLQNASILKLSQAKTDMLMAVNETQEIERQRIARDLHDSVGSLLSTLRLNLGSIQDSIRSDKKDIIHATYKLLDHTTSEVRRVSHDLMPASLINHGLVAALEEIYSKQTKPAIRIIVDSFGNKRMAQTTEIILLRIIQELVGNTIKHAEASEISIQLIDLKGIISLIYEDDGKGFEVAPLSGSEGMGLQNIKSRLEYLKGTMEVSSYPQKGFTCLIEIPDKLT